MLTEIDICNKALYRLGANKIESATGKVIDLDPDDSTEALLCKALYEIMRDIVTEDGVWSFALERITLDKLDPPPSTDAAYAGRPFFDIPLDALIIYRCILPGSTSIYTEAETQVNWRKEGKYILADAGKVAVQYIKQITDTTLFTNKYIDALSIRLAMELTTPLP